VRIDSTPRELAVIERVNEAPRGKDDVRCVTLLLARVARSLHAAHEHGLVHRDVKPGNIMLTHAGDPVILDFGLARADDETLALTQTGEACGTPAYMAPEQWGARSRASTRARTCISSA
jgi:serine/threonine-protein kinase